MVVTLVPLGVGAETNILRSIAPGVVWVAALLAALLSLPRMFATDHEDGTLEQMLVAAEPVPVIVVAKVAAHWIVTGVPMTIFATIFGVMFDLELDVTLVMVASLLIGTPVLSLVGAVGAALTLGLRAGGVLTSLLVLPLYIPVLIFGSGAATAAAMSLSPASHFMIVGGLSLFALALAPLQWLRRCGLPNSKPSLFRTKIIHRRRTEPDEHFNYIGRLLSQGREAYSMVYERSTGALCRRRLSRVLRLPD